MQQYIEATFYSILVKNCNTRLFFVILAHSTKPSGYYFCYDLIGNFISKVDKSLCPTLSKSILIE